jgi:hypothetical protein
VGPHLETPYRFWRYTNDATGKESIYLNIATNNFVEGTNFNLPLNTLDGFRQDYVMV